MEKANYNDILEDVRLTNYSAQMLMTASRWARFLSILGFVIYGLLIVGVILSAVATSCSTCRIPRMDVATGMYHMPTMSSWWFAVSITVISIVYYIPLYLQFRFANMTRKAFRNRDTAALTEAFHSLKNYYVIIGIFTIVLILISVLCTLAIWGMVAYM